MFLTVKMDLSSYSPFNMKYHFEINAAYYYIYPSHSMVTVGDVTDNGDNLFFSLQILPVMIDKGKQSK